MIITNPDQLRVHCEDVLPEEVDGIRTQLEAELKQSAKNGFPGIGLAAPQIGIAKKMAIIRIADGMGHFRHVDLINCNIEKQYDLVSFKGEGCLSFPGVSKNTTRYNEVYVVRNLLSPFSFIATGIAAVAIQHELEHLQGILLIDK